MTSIILIAIIIGLTISYYSVFIVKKIYKFKNTAKAGVARILGVSSVAVVTAVGIYLLNNVFWRDSELPFIVSVTFTTSVITGLIFFFWLNRKAINKLYYK